MICGAGRQRQVELGALGRAAAGFLGRAGAGIQVASVFVHVGKDDAGVVLERVEDSVSMVCVDIDVSDPFQSRFVAQQLDSHTAVVEHAKAGCAVARCVVQPGNGHESAAALLLHDGSGGIQGSPHDAGSRLKDSAEGGRIARIQKPLSAGRAFAHEVHVSRRVKGAQFIFGGHAWLEHVHAPIQAARLKLADKSGMPIGTEGVAVTETVASQALAHDYRDVAVHLSAAAPGRRSYGRSLTQR